MRSEQFDNEAMTISLALDGEVELSVLAEALAAFKDLLAAVAAEEHAEVTGWRITNLEAGSALIEAAPHGPDPAALMRTMGAVQRTAERVERGDWDQLPPRVAKPARRLRQVVGGEVSGLVLETAAGRSEWCRATAPGAVAAGTVSGLGSVTGTITRITGGDRLQFAMSDERSGHLLTCSVSAEFAERLREMWNRRAIVSGRVTRDRATGAPTALTRITRIEPARASKPGAFLRARGILTPAPDAESVDSIIRRMRDVG